MENLDIGINKGDDFLMHGLEGLQALGRKATYEPHSPASSVPYGLSPLKHPPDMALDLSGGGLHGVQQMTSLAAFTAFSFKKVVAEQKLEAYKKHSFDFSTNVTLDAGEAKLWVLCVLAFPDLWEQEILGIQKDKQLMKALEAGFKGLFLMDINNNPEPVKIFFIRLVAVLIQNDYKHLLALLEKLIKMDDTFKNDAFKFPGEDLDQNLESMVDWVTQDKKWFNAQGINTDRHDDEQGMPFLCSLTIAYRDIFGYLEEAVEV